MMFFNSSIRPNNIRTQASQTKNKHHSCSTGLIPKEKHDNESTVGTNLPIAICSFAILKDEQKVKTYTRAH